MGAPPAVLVVLFDFEDLEVHAMRVLLRYQSYHLHCEASAPYPSVSCACPSSRSTAHWWSPLFQCMGWAI